MGTAQYKMSDGTIEQIDEERAHQVDLGFTQERDDDNFPHEWIEIIQKYTAKADAAMEPDDYRAALVKVAAVAVAAIESYDRLS